MANGKLTVKVVSPEDTVFSDVATAVVAPAWDGRVGILPGHAPMITLLGSGELNIESGGARHVYHIAGGLLKVQGNLITVLTEYASEEPPSRDLVKELLGTQIDLDAVDQRISENVPNNPLA